MEMKRNLATLVVAVMVALCLPMAAWAGGGMPTRFFVDFNDLNLVFSPTGNTIQVSTGDKVLSYGGDWQFKKLKPYLFHLRLKI